VSRRPRSLLSASPRNLNVGELRLDLVASVLQEWRKLQLLSELVLRLVVKEPGRVGRNLEVDPVWLAEVDGVEVADNVYKVPF